MEYRLVFPPFSFVTKPERVFQEEPSNSGLEEIIHGFFPKSSSKRSCDETNIPQIYDMYDHGLKKGIKNKHFGFSFDFQRVPDQFKNLNGPKTSFLSRKQRSPLITRRRR
jgi:hypothetical protein